GVGVSSKSPTCPKRPRLPGVIDRRKNQHSCARSRARQEKFLRAIVRCSDPARPLLRDEPLSPHRRHAASEKLTAPTSALSPRPFKWVVSHLEARVGRAPLMSAKLQQLSGTARQTASQLPQEQRRCLSASGPSGRRALRWRR